MLETTEEHSVCATLSLDLTLSSAVRTGFERAAPTQVQFGAGGFQIRDMSKGGRIVAIEEFLPMGRC